MRRAGDAPQVLAMNYQATKIRLTCNERTIREWSAYMLDHIDEVSLALCNEGVRHEMWFMGRDTSLFLIGVMDVDDAAASRAIAARSQLGVDEAHRRFKRHWDKRSLQKLSIDRGRIPAFDDCELLFEARS
jgi:hypothetical protein